MIEILENFFSLLLTIFIASMPIAWVWALYHMVKCWKVESCTDRKCKYWDLCSHNEEEKKQDEIEMRVQWLMHKYGLTEEDIKEEPK